MHRKPRVQTSVNRNRPAWFHSQSGNWVQLIKLVLHWNRPINWNGDSSRITLFRGLRKFLPSTMNYTGADTSTAVNDKRKPLASKK